MTGDAILSAISRRFSLLQAGPVLDQMQTRSNRTEGVSVDDAMAPSAHTMCEKEEREKSGVEWNSLGNGTFIVQSPSF
jgi:hypothetical protein